VLAKNYTPPKMKKVSSCFRKNHNKLNSR